ncbi:MAG: deoxyribodipyrimidine photo-lyase [Bdellovibrionales bacterium]
MKKKIHIFWFRRDLRLDDNIGLYKSLNNPEDGSATLPIFIFDPAITERLGENDLRLAMLHHQIEKLNQKLSAEGKQEILPFYGAPIDQFKQLASEFDLTKIYFNKGFSPFGRKRDQEIRDWAKSKSIGIKEFTDHIVFHPGEILNGQGKDYQVFTPFKKQWLKQFSKEMVKEYGSEKSNLSSFPGSFKKADPLEKSFLEMEDPLKPIAIGDQTIQNYQEQRDFPWIKDGVSNLSPLLRFGFYSNRRAHRLALGQSSVFQSELIWREFFMHHLYFHPHVCNKEFQKIYIGIPWLEDHEGFEKWKKGQTGFAIIDAGMRELAATGYMHNRVRMVVANFLTKQLLIDWRWGERYFAEKLLDYELSSNVCNWQWAAGTGVDAAPYFRIFNPDTQLVKFDKQQEYTRKWVPEYGTFNYPEPMIDLKVGRNRAMEFFKEWREKNKDATV